MLNRSRPVGRDELIAPLWPTELPADPDESLSFVVGRDGYDAPLRDPALTSGCLVVSPEVRLAPEYPFPAAIDDALAAAQWLVAQAGSLCGMRPASRRW